MAQDLKDSFDYLRYCQEVEGYTRAKNRIENFGHSAAYKSHRLYQRDLETVRLFDNKYPMACTEGVPQKESE